MILVDANVLLYAYQLRSEHHERCRLWVEEAVSGHEPVCIAWVTLLAFIRISTRDFSRFPKLKLVNPAAVA